jgi:hypothetical protein
VCSRDNYEFCISVVAGNWTSLLYAVFHTIPCSKYSTVYITITGHVLPSACGRWNDDCANGLFGRYCCWKVLMVISVLHDLIKSNIYIYIYICGAT